MQQNIAFEKNNKINELTITVMSCLEVMKNSGRHKLEVSTGM